VVFLDPENSPSEVYSLRAVHLGDDQSRVLWGRVRSSFAALGNPSFRAWESGAPSGAEKTVGALFVWDFLSVAGTVGQPIKVKCHRPARAEVFVRELLQRK